MCCTPVLQTGNPLPFAVRERSVHLDLDPVPKSVRLARAFVSAQLRDVPGSGLREMALLCASELVTNAVIHARTQLQIGVTVDDKLVLIAVGDHNALRPEQKPYGDYEVGGRGLVIVGRVAADWGTVTSDQGKTVWCAVLKDPVPTGGGMSS